MATVDQEPILNKEGDPPLYKEADKLLQFAEELEEKCEQYENKMWTSLAISASIVAALIGRAIYLTYGGSPGDPHSLWLAFAFFYATLVLLYLLLSRARLRRKLTRDRRALYRIVDMLRELEMGIVRSDALSTLEQVEFRIRLSRFDIGPESDHLVVPITPKPAPLEPQPVPVHDLREAEQPSHS